MSHLRNPSKGRIVAPPNITGREIASLASDAIGAVASLAILLALCYLLVRGCLFAFSGVQEILATQMAILYKGIAAFTFLVVMGMLTLCVSKLCVVFEGALRSYLSDMRERVSGPSIDSVLRSLMIFGVLTPEHLGVIHNSSPKSVLRVLEEAAELEEPLVRTLGLSTPGPLQRCYLLTKAGLLKGERNRRIEMARRAARDPRPLAAIYVVHRLPHGQRYRTPDLIITPDGDILVLEDPFGLSRASITDGRWARLERFLRER